MFFIEQQACSIDKANTEKMAITHMSDFSLNYLRHRETVDSETILVPYNLRPPITIISKKGYTNLMNHLKNVHKDSWEDEYRKSKTKEQAILPYPK